MLSQTLRRGRLRQRAEASLSAKLDKGTGRTVRPSASEPGIDALSNNALTRGRSET